MGRKTRRGLASLAEETAGAVLALVALFLPIAIVCTGMVVDLGTVFFVRKAVQAACDLGALAGVQELDWDLLAVGEVVIRPDQGRTVSEEVTLRNLDAVQGLLENLVIVSQVDNPPAVDEPAVTVTALYTVRTPFLAMIRPLESGWRGRALAEASVVHRTKW